MHKQKIPLPKALFLLILVTILVSGSGYLGVQTLFKEIRKKKVSSPANLTTIIQTGPSREALKTSYLAELLNLSCDRLVTSRDFDLKQARARLLLSPVIKEAEVKLYPPQTVYVAYTVRQPIARLYDVENGVLDEEGVLFPLSPFFAPKTLPEIYLGLASKVSWNQSLSSPHFTLALTLLKLLSSSPYRDLFRTLRIDVSKSQTKSYGTREIVLLIHETFGTDILLRLTPKNYLQELGNYLELRKQLAMSPPPSLTIDLRIANLAFMQ